VAVLVVVLFCFMRGQVRLVVNNATMLFLTVATIAELKIAANAVVMAESLLLAAGYLGAVAWIVPVFHKRRAKPGAPAAPSAPDHGATPPRQGRRLRHGRPAGRHRAGGVRGDVRLGPGRRSGD